MCCRGLYNSLFGVVNPWRRQRFLASSATHGVFTNQLEAAGRRQAEIDRRIAAAQKELDDRKRARAGKGSGRMKKAEQKKDDSLNALLVRLRAGYLPGELMSNPLTRWRA